MTLRNLSISAALLLMSCACTPRYSTLKPPYPLQGGLVSDSRIQQIAGAQCLQQTPDRLLPPHPFTTDGCTLWPTGSWAECCVQHDISYWCGGPRALRREADKQLQMCIADHGGKINSMVMRWGVRVGGQSWLPFPWRWGYGFDWLQRQSARRQTPVEPRAQ